MPDERNEQKEPLKNPEGGNGGGSGPGGGRGSGSDGNMRFSRSMFGWILILATAIVLFVMFRQDRNPERFSWSVFKTSILNSEFKKVTVRDEGSFYQLIGTPNPGFDNRYPNKVMTRRPVTSLDGPGWEELSDLMQAHNGELEYEPSSNQLVPILLGLLPYLLLFVVIWFFFLRQIRSAGGGLGMLGNFGRSRHRLLSKEHTNITFNDVAGIDEAKEELTEIVEFLKNPKKFQRLGGRIPRGVLLIGDPGV